MEVRPALIFSNEDKVGTLQPHDNALVATLWIGGYDVKRVLVDQGSGAEIMYPDLYKRLKLKPVDLACYDSPLVGFDGKTVIPKGQIRLPIQVGSESHGSEFHCSRCIFPLHFYYGKTLASCHGSCFFHLALEGEVSIRR